jgi:hypothetical protein
LTSHRSIIQKLTQSSPSANTGKLTLFFRGNENVTGLDNAAFLSANKITFVEDAGDTLHQQRSDDTRASVAGVNAGFDSGWVFDADTNYATSGARPIRWLAQGRDGSAAIDAGFSGFGKNDQDNEITGVHVSDGDPTPQGILGAKLPHLFEGGWRWFWTQQHGDNILFEVIAADSVGPPGEGNDQLTKLPTRSVPQGALRVESWQATSFGGRSVSRGAGTRLFRVATRSGGRR